MSDDVENQTAANPFDAAPSDVAPGDETKTESPVQRALRIKQAMIDARPKPPRGGRFQREQSARVQTGSSRPWMKK